MSSSHLSCNFELPMMYPQVAHATNMGIISKTSVSLASSCSPQPPSEAFSFVYFVHFSPSPPPSPGFMPHCSASSNMPHIICSWFSEQCLILLPLGLSACFTVPSHRANPLPQLLPPRSLFWPGGVHPPPMVSLSPCVNARNTVCLSGLLDLRSSRAEKELAHLFPAFSIESEAINVCLMNRAA